MKEFTTFIVVVLVLIFAALFFSGSERYGSLSDISVGLKDPATQYQD